MTVAQQTDVRSMYPGDGRRVPRPLGWRTVFVAAAVVAAVHAALWAATRPLVGAALVTGALALAAGVRRVDARSRARRRAGGTLHVGHRPRLRRDGPDGSG